jgi:hypothetical protein
VRGESDVAPAHPFVEFVLRSLRAINAEATPLADGKPTGLCWYQGHLGRLGGRRTRRHEESWFPPLVERFAQANVDAKPECLYPPPKRRCDLRVAWPALGRIWLEIKGAWRFTDAVGKARNGAFKKHLYSTAADADKLLTLTRADADHVSLLVVGFDNERWPINPVEHIGIIRRRLDPAWIETADEWPDPHRPGGHVRCWMWLRPVGVFGSRAEDAVRGNEAV